MTAAVSDDEAQALLTDHQTPKDLKATAICFNEPRLTDQSARRTVLEKTDGFVRVEDATTVNQVYEDDSATCINVLVCRRGAEVSFNRAANNCYRFYAGQISRGETACELLFNCARTLVSTKLKQ